MNQLAQFSHLVQWINPSTMVEGLIQKGSQVDFGRFLSAVHQSVGDQWLEPMLLAWAFEQQKTAALPVRYAALNFLLAVALDPHFAAHMTSDQVGELSTRVSLALEENRHQMVWWKSAYETDLLKLRQAYPELVHEATSAQTATLFFKQNLLDRENSVQPMI